jgi:hypothetical protein
MSNHRSIRPAKRRAILKIAPIWRAFIRGLGLSILILSFCTGRADAACYLSGPEFGFLNYRSTDDALRATYEFWYVRTIYPPVCQIAFNWSLQAAVVFRGVWDKANKTATESVNVLVHTPAFPQAPPATYVGSTSQKCQSDPWLVYKAGCSSWLPYSLGWGTNVGVSKQAKAQGWNTSLIPLSGFDYRGPYPASRPAMWCCFFNPWGGY